MEPKRGRDGVDDRIASDGFASDASDDSFSTSSSPPSPTLAERRALNMQRNAELLQRLGLQHGIVPRQLPPKRKRKSMDMSNDSAVDLGPRGMVLPTTTIKENGVEGSDLEAIYAKYPHREAQLRRLLGCLLSGSSHPHDYVPPPIICRGPSGTGKTAIVLDILGCLDDHQTAYVDCQTFEQIAGAEQIMNSISKQMRSKRHWNTLHRQRESSRKPTHLSRNGRVRTADNEHDRKRTRLSRSAATGVAANKDKSKQYTTYSLQADMSSLAESTDVPLCAVWNFGREQKERGANIAPSVLVLDHAELLLSKATNNKNLLSQLLLLPQTFELNLTIVLISSSYLLHETRVDNLMAANMSSTCSDLHPIIVHFPAYQPNQLKIILQHAFVRSKVVGSDRNSRIMDGVYHGFLDTLRQTIASRTSNANEIIQLARSLWHLYIQPLASEHGASTLETAKRALIAKGKEVSVDDLVRDVLPALNQKARPLFRHPNSVLNAGSPQDSKWHEFPKLTKYLLLAAYLCQVNHADKDKQLFSIRKSGRRRRPQDTTRDQQEESAFGSSIDKNQSILIRPRTFPLERVLSVYVSIVALQGSEVEDDGPIQHIGDLGFGDMLCTLREDGLLCEQPNQTATHATRLNDPRYYTTLTEDDAKSLARTLMFPLEKFTLT